ncbi:unnamed protein product [Ectocarpus sp. 4 AP-2014]
MPVPQHSSIAMDGKMGVLKTMLLLVFVSVDGGGLSKIYAVDAFVLPMPPSFSASRGILNSDCRNRPRWLQQLNLPLLLLQDELLLPRSSPGKKSSLSMGGKATDLGASPWKTDSRSVREWLGLSEREIDKLRETLISASRRNFLDQRLDLLANGQTDSVLGFLRVEFRMSKANIRSLISRHPQLLFMPRQQAVDRCSWLSENLSLSKKKLVKMLLKFPRLFGYSEKGSYAPLVEWFRSYLGMDTREVARLVVRLPQLFSFKPDENIEDTARFLESLGLSRKEVCKMVLLHPETFSYSIEAKVIPMLEWLQKELRASPDEVIQMVARYPSLLGCSQTKNLAPKFCFFRTTLKASVADIRAAVVATPSLLGYSLDYRICPRATLMVERGVVPDFGEHRWLLTTASEKNFEQWMKANSGTRRL